MRLPGLRGGPDLSGSNTVVDENSYAAGHGVVVLDDSVFRQGRQTLPKVRSKITFMKGSITDHRRPFQKAMGPGPTTSFTFAGHALPVPRSRSRNPVDTNRHQT